MSLILALGACDSSQDRAPAAPTLVGAPDDPVAGAIPDLDPKILPNGYTGDHPQLPGMPLSVDTVLVTFSLNTTVGQANRILNDVGAEIVGGIPGVPGVAEGILVLRTPTKTHGEMMKFIDDLEARPEVQLVLQDVRLEPLTTPPRPGPFNVTTWVGPDQQLGTADDTVSGSSWSWSVAPGGHNWGLESISAPQLWNLNDAVKGRSKLQIIDTGFANPHLDLPAGPNVKFMDNVQAAHGTHVAGTAAGQWGDGVGIDGVNPFATMTLRSIRTLAEAAKKVEGATVTDVINMSLGHNWHKHTPPVNPGLSEDARRQVNKEGRLFESTLRVLASKRQSERAPMGDLPQIVVAAGNDSGKPALDNAVIDARWSSPMTNAALVRGLANIIVVEAVGPTGGRATFSNINGHIAAPGSSIVSGSWFAAAGTSIWASSQGTSMASPHVAGAVSYFYALNPDLPRPDLTSNPVLDALQGSSVPATATGVVTAGRMDAFAAAIALDPDFVLPRLVDVDDGTADGNDRSTAEDARGDGAVDMRDFRRFRDWLLRIQGVTLDGSPMHIKHDLNGDGVVEAVAMENVYPRGDFNGDGVLDRHTPRYLPGLGDVTDLDVLRSRFKDDNYAATELDLLLDSGDLTIDARACLADDTAAKAIVSIRLSGTQTPVRTATISKDDPVFVFTQTRDNLPYTALIAILDAQGNSLAVDETEVMFGPGTDEMWIPACGFAITALDPAMGVEGDEVRIEGHGFADEARANVVSFRDPDTGTTLSAPVIGGDLDPSEPVIAALRVIVPTGIDAAPVWEVVVEHSGFQSNALLFRVGQPFEAIELGDRSYSDINNSGMLVGGNAILTPRPGAVAGDPPVWFVDDDGDGQNDLVTELVAHENTHGVGRSVQGFAINDAGHVVGSAGVLNWKNQNDRQGTFWADPAAPVDVEALINTIVQDEMFPDVGLAYLQLPRPPEVHGINNAGDMMVNLPGNSRFPSPPSIVVLKGQSTITSLGGDPELIGHIPGRTATGKVVYPAGRGVDINNAGVVVGTSPDDTGETRPSMWNASGSRTFLGVLSETGGGRPEAINSSGQIVGALPTATGTHPVRWDGTTPTDLGTLGGADGGAYDINDQGHIVGWMEDSMGDPHGVLILPAPAYGLEAGVHRLTDLVEGGLMRDERPRRITNNGLILTSKSRLLRPQ